MKKAEVFRRFSLESIVLNETAFRRGEGDPSAPGQVDHRGSYHVVNAEAGSAVFAVEVESDFLDEAGEKIASTSVSYVLAYSLDADFEPSPEELQFFMDQGVVFQAHPYLREFIASLTSRAGLPAALLPVLVRDDDLAPEDESG